MFLGLVLNVKQQVEHCESYCGKILIWYLAKEF